MDRPAAIGKPLPGPDGTQHYIREIVGIRGLAQGRAHTAQKITAAANLLVRVATQRGDVARLVSGEALTSSMDAHGPYTVATTHAGKWKWTDRVNAESEDLSERGTHARH